MRLCNIPWPVMVSWNGEHWIPATTSVIGEKRETSWKKLAQNLIKLVHTKKNFFNGAGREREESWAVWLSRRRSESVFQYLFLKGWSIAADVVANSAFHLICGCFLLVHITRRTTSLLHPGGANNFSSNWSTDQTCRSKAQWTSLGSWVNWMWVWSITSKTKIKLNFIKIFIIYHNFLFLKW